MLSRWWSRGQDSASHCCPRYKLTSINISIGLPKQPVILSLLNYGNVNSLLHFLLFVDVSARADHRNFSN
jgi:hypothetical protein